MLVTTNHVLFRGTVGSFAIDVKLRDVVSVNDVRSLLLLDNGLDIFTKSEKLCFGTFVTNGHRDEALVLIRQTEVLNFCFWSHAQKALAGPSCFILDER